MVWGVGCFKAIRALGFRICELAARSPKPPGPGGPAIRRFFASQSPKTLNPQRDPLFLPKTCKPGIRFGPISPSFQTDPGLVWLQLFFAAFFMPPVPGSLEIKMGSMLACQDELQKDSMRASVLEM